MITLTLEEWKAASGLYGVPDEVQLARAVESFEQAPRLKDLRNGILPDLVMPFIVTTAYLIGPDAVAKLGAHYYDPIALAEPAVQAWIQTATPRELRPLCGRTLPWDPESLTASILSQFKLGDWEGVKLYDLLVQPPATPRQANWNDPAQMLVRLYTHSYEENAAKDGSYEFVQERGLYENFDFLAGAWINGVEDIIVCTRKSYEGGRTGPASQQMTHMLMRTADPATGEPRDPLMWETLPKKFYRGAEQIQKGEIRRGHYFNTLKSNLLSLVESGGGDAEGMLAALAEPIDAFLKASLVSPLVDALIGLGQADLAEAVLTFLDPWVPEDE